MSKNKRSYESYDDETDDNKNNKKDHNKDDFDWLSTKQKFYAAATAGVGLTFAALAYRYKVAAPHQYIVKTGPMIKEISWHKKTFLFPFQKYKFINITPTTYEYTSRNMTSERVECSLPFTLNVGPPDPNEDPKGFLTYVKLMDSEGDKKRENVVISVTSGESRILCANLSAQQLASDREGFRRTISDNIQNDLLKFGIKLFNINVGELVDSEGNEYFHHLKQNTLQNAKSDALIATSDAKKRQEVGEKEREADTRQNKAKLEAITVVEENKNERMKAQSLMELEVTKADYKKQTEMARLNAKMEVAAKDIDLTKDLNERKLSEQTTQLRANEISKAIIKAETIVKDSEGQADAMRKIADAELYKAQQYANEILAKLRAEAEGKFLLLKAEADGKLLLLKSEAEGKKAILEGEAEGLNKLFANGNREDAMKYLAIRTGTYEKIAQSIADGFKGMGPEIKLWHTGNGNSNAFNSITDIFQSVPPLFDFLTDQLKLGGSNKNSDGRNKNSNGDQSKETQKSI